jgi:threonine/homoserine/homoserine lactone efflux protein
MTDFIPSLPVMLAFALAALVLFVTPGPDMALFLLRAIRYGRGHAIAAILDISIGLLCHSILAAFGISVLIAAAPTMFLALKIIGAIYLIYLAIKALRSGDALTLAASARTPPKLRDSYVAGLGINLLNPKIVLFFITFLPQFIDRHDPHASGKLFFLGLEFIVITTPLAIGMACAAGWLSKLLTQNKWVAQVLNWSFAGVFTAYAATILLTEARR